MPKLLYGNSGSTGFEPGLARLRTRGSKHNATEPSARVFDSAINAPLTYLRGRQAGTPKINLRAGGHESGAACPRGQVATNVLIYCPDTPGVVRYPRCSHSAIRLVSNVPARASYLPWSCRQQSGSHVLIGGLVYVFIRACSKALFHQYGCVFDKVSWDDSRGCLDSGPHSCFA